MLADHFLDGVAIALLGFDDQDCFGLFHDPPFPTVGGGDRKPVCASRQLSFNQGATDKTRLIDGAKRDIENSHQRPSLTSCGQTSFASTGDRSVNPVSSAWSRSTYAQRSFWWADSFQSKPQRARERSHSPSGRQKFRR